MNLEDEVLDEVQRHFPEVDTIQHIEDGINTIYTFTSDRDRFIIKIGTHNSEEVRAEPFIMKELNKNGVPTPTIVKTGSVRTWPYFISEFINGDQLEYVDTEDVGIVEDISYDIGATLAKIHNVECPIGKLNVEKGSLAGDGLEWEYSYRNTLDLFAEQAKSNYPSLGSKSKELIYRLDIPEIDKSVMNPVDLHTRNVFIKNGSIVGLIDFERVYGGHPRWSYEITLSSLLKDRRENSTIRKRFKSGYQTISDEPESYPIFDLSAVLREMRAAHIWWDDPKNQESEFQSRLDSIIEQVD